MPIGCGSPGAELARRTPRCVHRPVPAACGVLASCVHAHRASRPSAAAAFVGACARRAA